MRSVIVQKYGGTSLGESSRIQNVYKIIQNSAEKHALIVVVSALSSTLKEEGTTATLIKASEEALKKGNFLRYLEQIKIFHEKIIENLDFSDSNHKKWAQEKVQKEMQHIFSFLEAISVIGELSKKSQDVVLAVGEKLSAIILSAYMNNKGLEAVYVDASQLIENTKHTAVHAAFLSEVRKVLKQKLENFGDKIPVVTGFLGNIPGGIMDGIGRGYSDFTAAAIAASVHAKELQIWKEVDGIFSADPRKVENAYILPNISPEEAAEITFYGSEVIHPFTMEQVVKANIPTRIKNTGHPERLGTVIDPSVKDRKIDFKPTAVTCKRNITVLSIQSNRMLMSHGFMAKVFNILEKYAIVIDLISTSEVSISLTTANVQNLPQAVKECKEFSEVQMISNLAIVSLVGLGMKKKLGTAGQMFQTLAENGVNIEMITQGASEINISCVVKDEDAIQALRAIHEAMLIERK